MAYADRLTQPELGVFFVLLISGWNVACSDAPLPSSWEDSSNPGHTLINGELYRWHQCLSFDDDFGQIPSSIDPKKGLGSSGELSFNLLTYGLAEDITADPVLDALNNNPNRSDRDTAILESDLSVVTSTGSFIDLSNNPWSATATDLYLGEETISFGSGGGDDTSTRKTDITQRGAYGSRRRWHRSETLRESQKAPTALIVADWPITWQGRFAELPKYLVFAMDLDNQHFLMCFK